MSVSQIHRMKYFSVRWQETRRYAGDASVMFANAVALPPSGPSLQILKAVYPADERKV